MLLMLLLLLVLMLLLLLLVVVVVVVVVVEGEGEEPLKAPFKAAVDGDEEEACITLDETVLLVAAGLQLLLLTDEGN